MKADDRELGMSRNITRRDLLHGMGALAATSFVPGQAFADAALAAEQAGVYPPALTGLRGSHVGSFEVAHSSRVKASATGVRWPRQATEYTT